MIKSISEIYRALGEDSKREIVSAELCNERAIITDLLTDSRSLTEPETTLFFAIPSERNDGHKYIRELYDRGVRNFVVNYIPEDSSRKDANWVIVKDSISALQRVASSRDGLKGDVVAITGSRGKTTLKEWLYQLLEPDYNITRSPRSYNSQIGVPLSLWQIKENTDLAIIEAGISRKGEMAKLSRCIQPDVVIFTNIGDAHSSGFSSTEEKAYEKSLLIDEKKTKCIIYCQDYPELNDILSRFEESGIRSLSWSLNNKKAVVYIIPEKMDAGWVRLRYSYLGNPMKELVVPLSKEYDLENACNALALMLYYGIEDESIESRFKKLHKIGTRLNVLEAINNCSVVLDSYTSDFSSLVPAIDFIRRRKTQEQSIVLILSDLHHESESIAEQCKAIATLAKKSGVKRFIGVGASLMKYRSVFGSEATFFESVPELMTHITASDFSDEIILIKGSPEYDLSAIAEMLEVKKHETVLEVNLDSIVSNFNYFKGFLPSECGIICMVKAFGYGAGSYEIAKTLQDCGASYLAVAVLDEGLELRKKGITMPIMVMNPKTANYRSMFANRLEPEIYSFEMLRDVITEAKKSNIRNYPIHIKLDTGMHRTGFIKEELPVLIKLLNESDEVLIKSVFSHLATADCVDMDDYTKMQLDTFEENTRYMLSAYKSGFMRHILNSAGILRFPEYHYDMARLGIGLYGANTLPAEMEKPLAVVSTLRTVIIALREYQPGEAVGYGRKGQLHKVSKIATIPIGYADGMNRHFGNGRLSVLVNGRWVPTIGNICMDACMLDVTGVECNIGDSVEIFGQNAALQRMADVLDTIPYEILTSISPRVKRVYYRE